jgi:hypothetical protein
MRLGGPEFGLLQGRARVSIVRPGLDDLRVLDYCPVEVLLAFGKLRGTPRVARGATRRQERRAQEERRAISSPDSRWR